MGRTARLGIWIGVAGAMALVGCADPIGASEAALLDGRKFAGFSSVRGRWEDSSVGNKPIRNVSAHDGRLMIERVNDALYAYAIPHAMVTSRADRDPGDPRYRGIDRTDDRLPFTFPASVSDAEQRGFGELAHFTTAFDPRFGPALKRTATVQDCRDLSPGESTMGALDTTGPFACYRLIFVDSDGGSNLMQAPARVVVRMFDEGGGVLPRPAVVEAEILAPPERMLFANEGAGGQPGGYQGFEQNITADGRLLIFRTRGRRPLYTAYAFNLTPWDATTWEQPRGLHELHAREAGRRICLGGPEGHPDAESRGCARFEDFYPLARQPIRDNDGSVVDSPFNCTYPWVTPEGTDVLCSSRMRSAAVAFGEATGYHVMYLDGPLNAARHYDRGCDGTCNGQSQWMAYGRASGFWAAFREAPRLLDGFGRHPSNFSMVLFHHYRPSQENWVTHEADFLAPRGGFALYLPMCEYMSIVNDIRSPINGFADVGSVVPDHSMNHHLGYLNAGASLPWEYYPEVHRQLATRRSTAMRYGSASTPWWEYSQMGFIGRGVLFRPGGAVRVERPAAADPASWDLRDISVSLAVRPYAAQTASLDGEADLLRIDGGLRVSFDRAAGASRDALVIHVSGPDGEQSHRVADFFRPDDWTHVGLDVLSSPPRIAVYRDGAPLHEVSLDTAVGTPALDADLVVGPANLPLDDAADALFVLDEVAVHPEPQGHEGYLRLAAAPADVRLGFYTGDEAPPAQDARVVEQLSTAGIEVPSDLVDSVVFPEELVSDLYGGRFTEVVALGERLFHDPLLSKPDEAHRGEVSCASCHRADGLVFTDGLDRAVGVGGAPLELNSPTVTNRLFSRRQFFDARSAGLVEQVRLPIENPLEMNGDVAAILAAINASDCDLLPEFHQAFDFEGEVTMEHVSRAVAAYMLSLVTGTDTVARHLGESPLTDEDRMLVARGSNLFFGKAMCSSCHDGPTFSDELLHASFTADLPIKTPSLLNVALTGPYMHDGSVSELDGVLDHYASLDGFVDGEGEAPDAEERALLEGELELRPIDLREDERRALLAFLCALTDPSALSASSAVDPACAQLLRDVAPGAEPTEPILSQGCNAGEAPPTGGVDDVPRPGSAPDPGPGGLEGGVVGGCRVSVGGSPSTAVFLACALAWLGSRRSRRSRRA